MFEGINMNWHSFYIKNKFFKLLNSFIIINYV